MDFDNEMQYLEDMDKLIRQMDCDDSFYIEELELEIDYEYYMEEYLWELEELQFEEHDLMEYIMSSDYQYRIIAREYGDEDHNIDSDLFCRNLKLGTNK